MRKIIQLIIEISTRIPFQDIPNTTAEYRNQNPKLRIVKKYLHRYLKLKFGKQLPLLKDQKLLENSERLLWIYTAKQNIGDAIMDLSARALLAEKGKIDLLCSENLVSVFKDDRIFSHVSANIEDFTKNKYDLVILSEFNHPSIKIKIKHFLKVPMVCLFGFFYGPDRNQVLFSHFSANAIFKLNHSAEELFKTAKPYLQYKNPTGSNPTESGALAIAIGGIDSSRSYQNWPAVIHRLNEQGPDSPKTILLLGSLNGKEEAEKIMSLSARNLQILNYVGKLTIKETHQKLGDARLVVACDGGLMHLAHTTETPSISLFRKEERPEMRLTSATKGIRIHSQGSVSEVSPETIVQSILSLWCTPGQNNRNVQAKGEL